MQVNYKKMKIFTSAQIHELDNYTISHEPIRSIDLMERAARKLTDAITTKWGKEKEVVVFAGPGNNGGDALAVARMMVDKGYSVSVYLFNINDKLSEDCQTNRDRLVQTRRLKAFVEVSQEFDPPVLEPQMLIIDGLFGSGVNKPLSGGFAALVKYINASDATVVSIDLPSGMMTEDNTYNVRANIIKADLTLTLGSKKLCMFLPDNQSKLGKIEVLDIGLSQEGYAKINTPFYTTDEEHIAKMMMRRNPFAHKGNMGHSLIIAGAYGMAGAAVLAARACMRSGAGKLTVHTPKRNLAILQMTVPEAIVQPDREETFFSQAVETTDFDAIGIGPGLGRNENSAIALISQVRSNKTPIVLDADALNILAAHRAWLQQLPQGLILTPHPKELDSLMGTAATDDYERLSHAMQLAQTINGYVLLKGHYSALCSHDGTIVFNTTGNAGMATAGAGDVLTGIITALLARGYERKEAVIIGMYLHGLAGDLAARELGEESLMASDIINYLPKAFLRLEE